MRTGIVRQHSEKDEDLGQKRVRRGSNDLEMDTTEDPSGRQHDVTL